MYLHKCQEIDLILHRANAMLTWICPLKSVYCRGGSKVRGGARDEPHRSNFLHFHALLKENWPKDLAGAPILYYRLLLQEILHPPLCWCQMIPQAVEIFFDKWSDRAADLCAWHIWMYLRSSLPFFLTCRRDGCAIIHWYLRERSSISCLAAPTSRKLSGTYFAKTGL